MEIFKRIPQMRVDLERIIIRKRLGMLATAKELGVTYATLKRFFGNGRCNTPALCAISEYIDKNREKEDKS